MTNLEGTIRKTVGNTYGLRTGPKSQHPLKPPKSPLLPIVFPRIAGGVLVRDGRIP